MVAGAWAVVWVKVATNDDEPVFESADAANSGTNKVIETEKVKIMAAEIDTEKCTGCGVCIKACPFGAISLDDDVAVIDDDICTECGMCIDECPCDAISL